MSSGAAIFYRMNERKPPIGEGSELVKYSRYHAASRLHQADNFLRRLRRFLRPAKARRMIGMAVYVAASPHLRFPRYIRTIDGGHWATDSAVLNWSNRAPLYSRRWFLME